MLPKPLRRFLGAATSSLADPPFRPSPWALPASPKPVATLEMELLSRCRCKLPFEKASMLLGYQPKVSSELACRRTVVWLEFAGSPVIGRPAR